MTLLLSLYLMNTVSVAIHSHLHEAAHHCPSEPCPGPNVSRATGCRFAEAFLAARRCAARDLQPREFFTLAPQHTARAWPPRPPPRRRWGPARPLAPLEDLAARVGAAARSLDLKGCLACCS